MSYKTNYLIEYTLVIYNKENSFIKKVLQEYFNIYIDNYYYNIFHTIDNCKYNLNNLKLEFNGIMEEMLDEYKAYELEVSNNEYSKNIKIIKELNEISFEIIKLDKLSFKDKDNIDKVIEDFIKSNNLINNLIGDRSNKLISLVKKYYVKINKIENYKDEFFNIKTKSFHNKENYKYLYLDKNIKALNMYRIGLVNKVYRDEDFYYDKFSMLLKKISIYILTHFESIKNSNKLFFVEFSDKFINRGKIIDKVYKLIDNPEENIAKNLLDISNKKNNKIKKIEDEIDNFSKANGIEYNEDQKRAIKTSLEENVTIITGGPGTGKTTIIKAIAGLFIDMHPVSEKEALSELALLAPTGRAAKRMSDITNLPASTIHRYLKWDKNTGTFEYNEYNRHSEKLIIIDEVSMIDTELFDALLKGIDFNARLVIVGDDNQLPSVGPGLILSDIISSECFNHIPLKEIYRQSSGSSIPYLCLSIKNHDLTEESISRKEDFAFLPVDAHVVKDTIREICKVSMKKGIDVNNIQILAPMYKGENGIDNLNITLQELFNPKDDRKDEIRIGEVTYRVGDKVLQLVNDPDNNIYNGDIGYIESINTKNKDEFLMVNFYGNGVFYKREDLINLKHAYAITIHKSQGSEFDHVIMPITMNYGRMLYNKLLYTGISRAKKSLTLLGNAQAFYMGTNNDYSLHRKTDLVLKILNKLN